MTPKILLAPKVCKIIILFGCEIDKSLPVDKFLVQGLCVLFLPPR